MKRSIPRVLTPLCLSLLTLGCFALPVEGDWFDDFSDGSITDGSPVSWSFDPGGFFPGDYTSNNGDFALVPLDGEVEDEIMIAWVDSQDFETTASVRTSATVLTEPAEVFTGQGNVGSLMFFDPTVLTGYFGVLDAGGGMYLFSATGGGTSEEIARFVDLEFNATEEVFVQLDHDGEFLSMTAWPVDESQPDPQIVIDDDSHQFGKSGIFFAEDNFMDASIFHSARASSSRITDDMGLVGDFNMDGDLDGADIDLLMNDVAAGSNSSTFDLNGDGQVNDGDRDSWLAAAGPANGFAGALLVGDANLDGIVDALDLNAVGITWQTDNANWTNGNFSGANTDAGDLNVMALNWQSSVPAASAVPEPSSSYLLVLLCASLLVVRRVGQAKK